MSYQPKPIDTSRVVFPRELEPLLERLSENVHEIWATQRLKDGWTLGARRDDLAKTHPCLIPYRELPEHEKHYDRIAVEGVLRTALALGVRLEASSPSTSSEAGFSVVASARVEGAGGQASAVALEAWNTYLKSQLGESSRGYTFDMDDTPERNRLAAFGIMGEALEFLNTALFPKYAEADRLALHHQRRHRCLAKTAILTGVFAVAFAVVQLALASVHPQWKSVPGWLEALAAISAAFAVIVGFVAKFNRQWFIRRHVAERLRLLRFRALGFAELWCGEFDLWKRSVQGEIDAILKISTLKDVEDWATSGDAEPFEPVPSRCAHDPAVLGAFRRYYQWKRVAFQASYFGRQAEKLRKYARPLAHLGLPFFILGMLAVALHFGADFAAHRADLAGRKETAHRLHEAGMYALALAALLPLASLGVRAWLGAFEPVRNASLFEAKQRALKSVSDQLARDSGGIANTMHHIAHVEHFLEHEHREWLRLMLEAEWFL